MFNVNLFPDKMTNAKVQRLREREAERRERIFDDKVRTIGVIKEALNEQVREKQRREEAEKDEQNAAGCSAPAQMQRCSITGKRLASSMKEVQERHEMEKAVNAYRRQNQQPWSRREFDLNDPGRCRGEAQMMLPGLVGEDPNSEGRRRRQQEQLRQWLVQQQRERAAERHRGKLEEQRYEQTRANMNHRTLQLQSMELERRREATAAATEYNLAKAGERCRPDKGSPDAEPTLSMMGVPGLCPSSDRRAPKESLLQIIQFQKHQIEERKRAEREEKREEERLHHLHLVSVRSAQITEKEQERLRTQLRQNLDVVNGKLSEIRKQQKPDIERGRIDDSFFSKFNSSSR